MLIVFGENHIVLRESLEVPLSTLRDRVDFREAATFESMFEAIGCGDKPDLIIFDLQMPGVDGVLGIARLKRKWPTVPVVVLSGIVDRRVIASAMDAGARGFIPKTSNVATMLSAVQVVLSGGKYVPPESLYSQYSEVMLKAPASTSLLGPSDEIARLTSREREVLDEIVEGKTNIEIAAHLGLAVSQANVLVRNVYRRIGVANRAAAVRVALRNC